MKNFYTKYDCTNLFIRNGKIWDKGPLRTFYSVETRHIITSYGDLYHSLLISRKRGNKPTVRVIYEGDGFKTIDVELVGDDWHYKWRFGLEDKIWSFLPEIQGD